MKIVCDTNVLVSGILFGGYARRILILSSRGRLFNHITDEILAEAKEVLLRPKFKLTPRQVVSIIDLFRDTFELVSPVTHYKVIAADPDDDCILDAAKEARAEAIVSGDNHLRALKSWEGIRILSPSELIGEIEG